MSNETRTRLLVALGAAVFLAVCATIVALALVVHPEIAVWPDL